MSIFKNFSFNKIKAGLEKTKEKFFNKITETITGKANIDETTLEKIEEILISADVGVESTELIIDNIRKELKKNTDRSTENVIKSMKMTISNLIIEGNLLKDFNDKPYIILLVGVNGVGKTTTIGKLANYYNELGKKVLIVAGDTFRAAANEQLEIWSKRAGVEIFNNNKASDPSSVVYDSLAFALKNTFDVVLIDTAGRLHNKSNLMKELEKINRVINKVTNKNPDETLLVIDANTGQNAILQVQEFSKIMDLTGLIITKIDGTAKGGIIINLCQRFKIPVKLIGVGEGIEDLQEFDKNLFIESLFNKN